MDFWATALALSDGTTIAIALDIDIQILTNQRAEQIRLEVSRATGLPVERIRASATHTHSGPTPYKSWIEKGYQLVEPWFADLSRWCAEAAREAVAALQPVVVRAGRGECRINTNRRSATPAGERFLGINPNGPCDHEVGVVVLDTLDNNVLATLVNYACHPTIMGPGNRLLTPDYPGEARRVVEDAVGGCCIFFQGAAGDQGPKQGFQADPRVYRQLGATLGHEAARVALELKCVPKGLRLREVVPSGAPLGMYDAVFDEHPGLPLRVCEREIQVPIREGLPEIKAATTNLASWQAKLKAARSGGDHEAAREATFMARRADLQLRMAEDFGGKTMAGVRTHFITAGDIALVGCNIEPFCEIGLAVKTHSPFPCTFMSGYTNGRMAYMATAEEWFQDGYEVENSPFGSGAAEALTQEILKTLTQLREKDDVAK